MKISSFDVKVFFGFFLREIEIFSFFAGKREFLILAGNCVFLFLAGKSDFCLFFAEKQHLQVLAKNMFFLC